MKIVWDDEPATTEQIMAADYLMNKPEILKEAVLFNDKNGLLTSSFTPPAIGELFFTFEVRLLRTAGEYRAIVWKGIRTGDARAILQGRIAYEHEN